MDMPLALLNRRRRGGASFEKTLFNVPGSRGFFYDFSDYSTQFTDAAGTTAITGVGQSLGLVLDKSRGLVRGPELATVTSVTGVAIGGPAFTNYIVTPTLTVNTTYEISFTVSGYSGSGDVGVAASGSRFSPAVGTAVISGNGVVRFIGINVTASALSLYTRSTNTANFSNISVRELPGNHATQATAGSRALTQVRPMGVIPRNLLTFSEAFDNAVWSKTRASITANAAVAPDGTTTADKLVEDTSVSLDHRVSQTFTSISGAAYTYSVYAKAAERSQITLWESASGSTRNVLFDLAAGTATPLTGTGLSPQITAVGNGWFRCSITVSSVSNTSGVLVYMTMAVGGVISYTGDGTSGVLFWGAQLEVGSTASTYQPTGPALINGEKRNLLTRTEEFNNAVWVKSRSSVTADAATAPDGTMTADKIVEDTSVVATHRVYQQIAKAASSLTRTFSVYLKAAERTKAVVRMTDNIENVAASISVDLSAGTIGTATVVGGSSISAPSASITALSNGWYRISLTATLDATITNPPAWVLLADDVGNVAYTGNGSSGVFVWGGQVEDSPTPTAYQRVVSTDEWYEPGFTSYRGIRFDGSDDFLQTAAIDFAGAESLGAELVTNGDFSSGSTGWTPQTGWTIGSGIASVNSAAAGTTNLNSTSVVVVSGKTYRITYTILSVSGTGIRATIGGVAETSFRTTTGTFTVLLTASSTASFGLTAGSTDTVGTVDNISVREVLIPADKMTVVAGVRKLSDAARGMVAELTNAATGRFALEAPQGAAANYGFASGGSTPVTAASAATFAAPDTSVLTGVGDIATDTLSLRRNGTQIATSAADQGTGNYANDIVYIGRRGGTTLPFNGVLTFLCVINRTLTAAELAQLEAFANSRTGAY